MWDFLFIPEHVKHSDEELLALLLKFLSSRKRKGKEDCKEERHNDFGIDRIRERFETSLFRDALIAPCSLTLSHCDGD